ncbi:MAG TPA: OstA-like protein, partial [Phnomibacter sp.]|nr:OstA-like protein [Phnomibacter sp.]
MRIVLLLLCLCGGGIATWAQPPGLDSTRRLEILQAGRYNFEKKDSLTSLLSLAVGVILKQEGTLFYADSAVLNQNTNVVEAFGNVHINDGDSLHTYSRYLRYRGNEKLAFLKDNVRLVDNKGSTLTTKELNYDINTGIAEYKSNGKVVNKKTTLTSKEGIYYDATKDVIFKKEVLMVDPQNTIRTDSLRYNSQTEIATFIAATTITTGKRKVYTTEGYYDLKLGKAVFTKRTSIVDSTYSIAADDMAFDDKEGLGQFKGNVVYIDTANGVTVMSEKLFANNKQASFLATDRPLMIIKQEDDSIYVRADTLYSGRITDLNGKRSIPEIAERSDSNYKAPELLGKDSSMNRFFEAWYHVRIFTDSVQAICDSFFYAGTDSAFRMFKNPIVWTNNSQITADTIYLFTQNRKATRMQAYYNGFIINEAAQN